MIILRQKQFSPQDYAGVKTALGARWVKFNRNWNARQERKARSRHQNQLDKNLGKVGLAKTRTQAIDTETGNPMTYSNGKPIMITKTVNTGSLLNNKEAAAVKGNMLQNYNEKNSKSQRSIRFQNPSIDPSTTRTSPTSTFLNSKAQQTPNTAQTGTNTVAPVLQNNNQNLSNGTQKQGIGTMGKVAIGAGVAAAGYGAYRMLKARKQKQQEEGD